MQFVDTLENPKKMSWEGTRVCLEVKIKKVETSLHLMGIVFKICEQRF